MQAGDHTLAGFADIRSHLTKPPYALPVPPVLTGTARRSMPAAPWCGWSSLAATASRQAVDADTPQTIWNNLTDRGFSMADQVAANGVEYKPLFLLGLDFNIMLWREQHLYLFADLSFCGHKPAPGVTNASQGVFDCRCHRASAACTFCNCPSWAPAACRNARATSSTLDKGTRTTCKSRSPRHRGAAPEYHQPRRSERW
jgi:hypothetical protein